jgi:hypothetical protein
MKTLFGAITVAAVIAALAAPAAFGQQKTAKQCRDEWRASTDAAKGKEKDYVAKCRGEGAAAAPAARPAGTAAKTAKECREEWRASTDAAKGKEKDYVAKCRGEGTAAAPAATPAAAPPAAGGAKTAKECREEWRASTDAAKGKEKDYVAKCRAGQTATAPPPAAPAPKSAAPAPTPAPEHKSAAPAPAPAPEQKSAAPAPAAPAPEQKSAAPAPAAPPPSAAAPSPAPTATAPARPAAPAPTPAATAPTGADQYQEEAQAKAHCPADIVVWVNLNSHIYHFSGGANYGRHFSEKGGAYMCEKDAQRESFRAAENEKRP